jgi:hypothetical protein
MSDNAPVLNVFFTELVAFTAAFDTALAALLAALDTVFATLKAAFFIFVAVFMTTFFAVVNEPVTLLDVLLLGFTFEFILLDETIDYDKQFDCVS